METACNTATRSQPRVSVVIPTRNRSTLLRRTLDSLEAQDYPHFEIVVVDDASNDDTPHLLASWSGPDRTAIWIDERQGSYVARNRGWVAARGGVIAFIDDDCLATPTWLSSLVVALQAPGTVAAQGVVRAEPGCITPFTHQIDQRTPGAPYRTCNIAYTRHVLEGMGGFDERLHNYGDTLLGLRARGVGTIAFAHDAVVLHPPRPREWRDRHAWVERFRNDVVFRKEAARHGMDSQERRAFEPFRWSDRFMPLVLWVVRPLRDALTFHLTYVIRHPRLYLKGLPLLMHERWEMLIALFMFWRDGP
ncbi:MAG: hypothetical protein NVS2B16_24820 [Chloroflexota bacterium]